VTAAKTGLQDIALFRLRSATARDPASLRAVNVERDALDVAVLGDGDNHHLLGDQGLDVEAALDLLSEISVRRSSP
jgi:hypothetical protein